VARALAARPELAALDRGIEAARQNVLVKRGAFYPKVAATAQYQQVDGGGKLMPRRVHPWNGRRVGILARGQAEARTPRGGVPDAQLELQRSGGPALRDRRAAGPRPRPGGRRQDQTREGRLPAGRGGAGDSPSCASRGRGHPGGALDAELALTTARTALRRPCATTPSPSQTWSAPSAAGSRGRAGGEMKRWDVKTAAMAASLAVNGAHAGRQDGRLACHGAAPPSSRRHGEACPRPRHRVAAVSLWYGQQAPVPQAPYGHGKIATSPRI
jgi:hypothetical protein